MKWFYNLKISAKLMFSFAIVLIITMVIGSLGIINLRNTDKDYSDLFEVNGVGMAHMGDIGISLNRIRVNVLYLILDKDTNDRNAFIATNKELEQQMLDSLELYKNLEVDEEDVQNYEDFQSELDKFLPLIEKIQSLAVAGQEEEAYRVIRTELAPVTTSMNTLVDKMFAYNVDGGNTLSKQITKTANNTVTTMLIVLVVCVLLTLGLGIFISAIISRPIKKLAGVSEALALGDVSVNVEATTKDEIGILMAAFQKMINNVRRQAKEADQIAAGDLNIEIQIQSEKDILSKSLKRVADTLRKLIGEMDHMSKEHDAGDIDVMVQEDKFDGAYKTMAHGVNEMVQGHIGVKKKAMACISEFAKGNFDAELEKFPGKKAFINENIEAVRKNLKDVNTEINKLIRASREGNLGERADILGFQGDWSSLMNGLNGLIDTMIKPVQEAADVLEEIAKGNLTVGVTGNYKGDHAKIKDTLNATINAFNEVLGDLNLAAEQVDSGAKQISDSSMALSQGATEQASTIEELTASTEEISSQTKINAQNAGEASRLAETAKENALQGNEQMKGMLKAMTEINDASASISRIIKVIDDIAFQTNILALNAAVEAARAGQHGKGFAVVAEEVRNLAARSADAAKETTDMIEGSIKKSEEGTRIANGTADALNSIVEVATQVASIVGDISIASNEQASGIAQINQGIMQVSQVVQTNSATSEEAAAASEELSSQAAILKKQVERFQLKKVGQTGYLEGNEINPDLLKLLENMTEKKKTGGVSEKEETAGKPSIDLSDKEFGKY